MLRIEHRVAESGFDPQAAYDTYSFQVIDAIFDPLFTYDYFARPVKLVPRTAAALPEITDGGRTYTIACKPGIYFADDPAFNGKRRELVAQDYVYTIKRMLDPKVRSYWLYLFEDSSSGSTRCSPPRASRARFDYDAPIEGLRRSIATRAASASRTRTTRSSTGSTTRSSRRSRARWSRSTATRVERVDGASGRHRRLPAEGVDARAEDRARGQPGLSRRDAIRRQPRRRRGRRADRARATPASSCRSPARVEISVIEEDAAAAAVVRQRRSSTISSCRRRSRRTCSTARQLQARVREARRQAAPRRSSPRSASSFFNMDDPVVGGYTPDEDRAAPRDRHGLRPRRLRSRMLPTARRMPATQLLPPGAPGHDPTLRADDPYDPAAARALLDKFGYKDRDGDGYRETPDGKPLTITKARRTDGDRPRRRRAVEALHGCDRHPHGVPQAEVAGAQQDVGSRASCRCGGSAWISAIPDGDAFFSPLYSKNIGTSNDARFRLPEYDRALRASRKLPDGTGAHGALPQDDRPGPRLRAVAAADRTRTTTCSRSRGCAATSSTRSCAASSATTTSTAPPGAGAGR